MVAVIVAVVAAGVIQTTVCRSWLPLSFPLLRAPAVVPVAVAVAVSVANVVVAVPVAVSAPDIGVAVAVAVAGAEIAFTVAVAVAGTVIGVAVVVAVAGTEIAVAVVVAVAAADVAVAVVVAVVAANVAVAVAVAVAVGDRQPWPTRSWPEQRQKQEEFLIASSGGCCCAVPQVQPSPAGARRPDRLRRNSGDFAIRATKLISCLLGVDGLTIAASSQFGSLLASPRRSAPARGRRSTPFGVVAPQALLYRRVSSRAALMHSVWSPGDWRGFVTWAATALVALFRVLLLAIPRRPRRRAHFLLRTTGSLSRRRAELRPCGACDNPHLPVRRSGE